MPYWYAIFDRKCDNMKKKYYSIQERFLHKLKKDFPECFKCPYLNIKNIYSGKVVCFYRTKDKCMFGGK